MLKVLPNQQRYNIKISTPDNRNSTTHLTDDVVGDISLEIEALKISHLSFRLKAPLLNAEWLRIGYKVDFYGGYIDSDYYYSNDLQTSNLFRHLFKGQIMTINISCSSDGIEYADITALDASWSKSSYSELIFRYPSKNSKRTWSNANTIKTSDIVKGIAQSLGVKVVVDIDKESDVEYTLSKQAVQDNETDWSFLRRLATRCSCYVWTSVENNSSIINFKSKTKAISTENYIEFVWSARTGNRSEFLQGSYLATPIIGDRDMAKLKNNQLPILQFTLNEIPALYGAHVTVISDYDDETGKEIQRYVTYDETKNELIYYELNNELIEKENSTPEGSAKLDKILDMGAFDIPWEVAKPYYKQVVIKQNITDTIDRPLLGVTINATVPGNVNIDPQQSYYVHGIARYSSLKNRSRMYWLKTMKHLWKEDGNFLTELELIA